MRKNDKAKVPFKRVKIVNYLEENKTVIKMLFCVNLTK